MSPSKLDSSDAKKISKSPDLTKVPETAPNSETRPFLSSLPAWVRKSVAALGLAHIFSSNPFPPPEKEDVAPPPVAPLMASPSKPNPMGGKLPPEYKELEIRFEENPSPTQGSMEKINIERNEKS